MSVEVTRQSRGSRPWGSTREMKTIAPSSPRVAQQVTSCWEILAVLRFLYSVLIFYFIVTSYHTGVA